MCCRRRATHQAARRGCGRRGLNNGVYEPRQSFLHKVVNHIIETRQQKQALAREEIVQPRALEEVKQERGVDERLAKELARKEWEVEKLKSKIEDLGMGVGDGVDWAGRSRGDLPSYREALKN